MTQQTLARHYSHLEPAERFPLIVAAAARGDEVERERLLQSAPRQWFGLPSHWGAATAFLSLSDFHFMKVLDLAARYLEAFALASGGRRKQEKTTFDRWDEVLDLGYEFATYLTGWRRFCATLLVDPVLLWQQLPGHETVQRAEQLACGRPAEGIPGAAFEAKGAAHYRARLTVGDPDWDVDEATEKLCWPTTAAEVARCLRIGWEERRQKWE